MKYVNSLEQRKYVTVWFSSIQERIQYWPTQYSYDLTVNSFGKVLAHVRNCLLMKKMSDIIILTDYPGSNFIDIILKFILILLNLHATCLPHHPSSVIYSSYHTLLCKLWNCSRFIINHVLMAIPPEDDAKHSNSFH